ncbi:MAG TPA: AsmA family protein, partial [Burkholderiales bacterium]
MKRLLQALEVLAWLMFFAFAGLVLALRFWLLPDIEHYRGDIVAAVTRAVGQPVKIGAIEAGWLGLRPQVSLYDVRVYDSAGQEALVLPVVDNVVSWRSIARGDLRLHSLAIDSPRLSVRRDAAGELYVAGIKLAASARGDSRLADWVLDQAEISVRNAQIEWLDEKRNAPPLTLTEVDVRLRNRGNEHLVGVSARPPARLGAALDVRAELAGRSLAEFSAWNGKLYLALGATDLSAWRAWVDY